MILSMLLVGLEVAAIFVSEMLLSLLKSYSLSMVPGDSRHLVFRKLGKGFWFLEKEKS